MPSFSVLPFFTGTVIGRYPSLVSIWWLVQLARSTDQPRRTSALIMRSATILAIRPTPVACYRE